MKFRMGLALAYCLLVPTMQAGTNFIAATGNLVDVQSAYWAAQSGSVFTDPNVVIIPGGSWTWTNLIQISNNVGFAGTGNRATEIVDAFPTNTSVGTFSFSFASANQFFFFSNIWFHTTSGNSHCVIKGGFAKTGGDSPPNPPGSRQSRMTVLRVTQCLFDGNWSTAIRPEGYVLGSIDNNQFSPSGAATGVYYYGQGDWAWDGPAPTWGDTNRLYIEHNGFNWVSAAGDANGAIDSYNGADWCFRYNQVTNINVGCHGTDSTGTARSTHTYEVYENDFYNTTTSTYNGFDFRGGAGLFFNNRQHGSHWNAYIAILNYRVTYTNVYGSGNPPCCNPWGPVTGFNPYDGNSDVYGNRPLDGIGATSPTDWSHFSNSLAPNGNPNGYVIQGSQPLYEWGNTNLTDHLNVNFLVANNYANTGSSPQISTAAQVIVSGRDYFNDAVMPGYTPLADPHPLDLPPAPPPPTTVLSLTNTGVAVSITNTGAVTISLPP